MNNELQNIESQYKSQILAALEQNALQGVFLPKRLHQIKEMKYRKIQHLLAQRTNK